MRVGLVGLGKMGSLLAQRLLGAGHEVVGHDLDPGALATAGLEPVRAAGSLEALAAALPAPRVVWVMLPAGAPTRAVLERLGDVLEPGDLVADGSNSNHHVSVGHAARLAERGVGFLDVGVSGGIWGLEGGFGLLVGGAPDMVESAAPVLDAIAAPGGWAHVGPSGAGHFAKTIHNGVEYALMQAYAEGFELLGASDLEVDVVGALDVWATACSARSWLLGHLVAALRADPGLEDVRGVVRDSGQGRWTLDEAVASGVPAPAIAAALFARFSSQHDDAPAMRALAALRRQIGGHAAEARG